MKQSSILERTVGANTGTETHAAATNSVRKTRLMTAEAVRAGHPDKFCDQLADRLLDEYLKDDPNTRAAIEVMAADGKILVAGEVTSEATVDVERVLKELCAEVGYTMAELSTDGTGLVPDEVLCRVARQTFDLRPAALIRELKLRRPMYAPLAVYGHFGRTDVDTPWEETENNENALLLAALLCAKE